MANNSVAPGRRQSGIRPRQNGREDAPISGDFKDVLAARPERAQDFGIFLIARRLDQHGPARQISNFHYPRLGGEVVRAQRHHDASDPEVGGRKPGQGADGDRIDRLAAIFQAQREAAKATGREHVIITGKNTKVSDAAETGSTIIRRDDLGPTDRAVDDRSVNGPGGSGGSLNLWQ